MMAAAHTLHYAQGIPVRKVSAVLKELTGVSVTPGALTLDALRHLAGPGAAYGDLRRQVRESPLVHTDDAGWRVRGAPVYLMEVAQQKCLAHLLQNANEVMESKRGPARRGR
jgi:hypothetical protein